MHTATDVMDEIATAVGIGGDQMWSWVLAPLVVLVGLYLTLRSGVVQFRWIPEMFRTITDKSALDEEGKPQSISAFQAFTLSAASRVGVGNIAGIGTAIAVGGPGAIFWMWLMALVGGATSLIESSLAQLFKIRTRDRAFRGGPAYYIERGLGSRKFAVLLILCFPFAFNSLQANTLAQSITAVVPVEATGWVP